MRLRGLAIVAVFFFPGLVQAYTNSRPLDPEDMLRIVEFAPDSEPQLSSDGAWLAYTTVDTSLESNIMSAHPDGFLWVGNIGGKATQVVPGDYADTPVWSPAGHQLAFYRTRENHRQLCLWTPDGKVRELGELFPKDQGLWPTENLAPQWSVDGATIVYPALMSMATQSDPEWQLLHSTDATMPGDAPFVDARKWTLIAVDVGTGQNHVLTPQPVVLKNFALSPDGTRVLYKEVIPETVMLFRREMLQEWLVSTQGGQAPEPILEKRSPSWVVFSANNRELIFPEKGRLCSINISDRRERVLVDKIPEQTREPRVASSGWLAFLAARPGTVPEDSKMYTIVEPTWDVFVTQLSQPKARTLADAEVQAQNSDLTWSADGRTLFYRSVDQQSYRETIRRWSTGGARTENVYASDQTIRGINVTHDGSRVLFSAQSAASPEDGYLLSAGKSVPQRVTDLNPQLAAFAFQVPKIIRFYSVDGNALDALLYLPAYASADQPVPVITYIYEKLSQFKNHFESEAQWYVSHGYGYLMPDVLVNPGFLSESYVKCVVPAVNAARAMGLTTGSFGVTGRSLGGIAGLSLISRSDVFAAAVLLAPPSDFFSTWADGRDRDIWTIETGQGRAGGTPWERHDRYIDNSPFFFADRVHTPVLIIHGKADFTVPFQQGMMMFSALRALHRSADLLIYRDADHSIVRGSRFRFIDLHQRTMEWWERYLRTNPEEKTKAAAR